MDLHAADLTVQHTASGVTLGPVHLLGSEEDIVGLCNDILDAFCATVEYRDQGERVVRAVGGGGGAWEPPMPIINVTNALTPGQPMTTREAGRAVARMLGTMEGETLRAEAIKAAQNAAEAAGLTP